MPVVVETVLMSVRHGKLYFRTATGLLADGANPDQLAGALAGARPGQLLHSTSWRFVADSVVLTYVAMPDPTPVGAVPLGPVTPLPYAEDPLAPAGVRVSERDVVVHACRHLAYLRRTDPLVSTSGDPDLWHALDAFEPGLAGLVR
jgi:hypothetical protein